MKKTLAVAFCATAALLAGCSSGNEATPTDTSATSTAGENAGFGNKIEFSNNDGAVLGGIVFREIAAVPANCLTDSSAQGNDPGQVLAIKLELHAGTMDMTVPDATTLKVNDEGGFTQALGFADHSCDDTFPPLITAPIGGKSQGWISVANNYPNPKSLVFVPLFLKLTGESDIDFVQATPSNSIISLPPIATPTAVAGTTTATTTAAAIQTEEQQTTVAPQPVIEPERVIVKCDYPVYENTQYSDGTRGQTEYCAAQLKVSADAEDAASRAICDGTICTYPNGVTRPDTDATKKPSPWVQSQNDWIKCKNAGNTDEYCRANT